MEITFVCRNCESANPIKIQAIDSDGFPVICPACGTTYWFTHESISEFEEFHPRAVKLLRKRKNFIVIAEDEPYFMPAYSMIRENEMQKGTWTEKDEQFFREAREDWRKNGYVPYGFLTILKNFINGR